jgi:methylmalonyl-CoA mutase N-terminal domain/subunit
LLTLHVFQVEKLRQVRAGRDAATAEAALKALNELAAKHADSLNNSNPEENLVTEISKFKQISPSQISP